MPKLYLKFHESVIREIILAEGTTTIGRLEENVIPIDNLAVSGRHARIICQNGACTLEDLNSTNGTHLNGRRISRIPLAHNAVITIGKHTLVFLDPDGARQTADDRTMVMRPAAAADATLVMAPPQAPFDADATIVRNAPLTAADMDRTIVRTPPPSRPAPARENAVATGLLTVLDGGDGTAHYSLDKKLVTIGKAESAEIRLKGFFAPKVAAVINRTGEGYSITSAIGDGKIMVNGSPVSGARQLRPLDIIEVSSLKLQFSLKE